MLFGFVIPSVAKDLLLWTTRASSCSLDKRVEDVLLELQRPCQRGGSSLRSECQVKYPRYLLES